MAGSGSLGDLSVSFSAQISGLTSGIMTAKGEITGFAQDAERQTGGISKMFSGMGSVIKLALVGAAVAVVGVGVASVKMAGDFQQSITKLYTTANESKANLQMVGDGILAMAGQVGTSSQQLAQSMYWIESGGLHGKTALDALRIAAEAAAAENANLDQVSIALAATLNAYGASGMTDAQAMNTLTAATGQGMMTFEQLSGSLASVLPASAKFGVSLTDVTAAMATMTAQGDPAANAATHLRQMMIALEAPSKIGAAALASVGLTSQQVADEMRNSLPGALQMIIDAVGKRFPEGSDAYNQAIKNIAGGSKQMMGFLELTGSHMKTFGDNVDTISGKVKAAGNDLMGWADIQQNFNFKMDAAKASIEALGIKIGSALLPVLGHVMDFINPLIVDFTNWATGSDGLAKALQPIGDFLHYIYTTLAGVDIKPLVAAWGSLSDSFAAVGRALGNLVGPLAQTVDGFDPLTKHIQSLATGGIKQVADLINGLSLSLNNLSVQIQTGTGWVGTLEGMVSTLQSVDWGGMFSALWTVLLQIGGYLDTTFTPVWLQLVKAFGDIRDAIQPILPQLKQFGTFLLDAAGGVAILAGSIVGGLITAFAGLLVGVIQIFTGIMQFISGAISFISGVINLFIDLTTGKWQKLGGDLGQMGQGIKEMFFGVWNTVVGIFSGAFAMIEGFAHGFVTTLNGLLGLVGIHISDFGTSAQNTLQNVSTSGSQSMNNLATNVNNSTNSIKTQSYSNVSFFTSQTMDMFQKMGAYGTSQMQSLDQNTIGYWNDIAAYISGHPINADINIGGGTNGVMPGSNARAAGGMNLPAGWTLVGEKGPEIINLHGGEDIYPNGTYPTTMNAYGGGGSNAYPASSGGGSVVHVYNDNRVYLDGQQMVDILAPRIVQKMRLKGAVRQ